MIDDHGGGRERRAGGFRAWRQRRMLERAVTEPMDDELGFGPGAGTSSLGFSGYHPSKQHEVEPAFAEIGFLAPRQGLVGFGDHHGVTMPANPRAAGF